MNNMTLLLIILCAFFLYFVITLVTVKRKEEVKRAFAGKPDDNGITVAIPKDRNKTIYTEGENVIDLSEYDKYIVSGRSLEKAGLPDGVFIYTKEINKEPIDSIFNHFVVFKLDKDRYSIEHPDIENPVDGYKVRKAITKLPTKLNENDFRLKMLKILNDDDEIKVKEKCVDCLFKKYISASIYYQDEDQLLVSITYKRGEEKDYSFHSKKFLRGVVKYKSVS